MSTESQKGSQNEKNPVSPSNSPDKFKPFSFIQKKQPESSLGARERISRASTLVMALNSQKASFMKSQRSDEGSTGMMEMKSKSLPKTHIMSTPAFLNKSDGCMSRGGSPQMMPARSLSQNQRYDFKNDQIPSTSPNRSKLQALCNKLSSLNTEIHNVQAKKQTKYSQQLGHLENLIQSHVDKSDALFAQIKTRCEDISHRQDQFSHQRE